MSLTTNTKSNNAGIANISIGRVVNDASALVADPVFVVGFAPRYIKWQDLTNRISLEWYEGMAANSAVRQVAAGTGTLDVAAGITPGTKAAGCPASATCIWMAIG
jgi:hypothetical protein